MYIEEVEREKRMRASRRSIVSVLNVVGFVCIFGSLLSLVLIGLELAPYILNWGETPEIAFSMLDYLFKLVVAILLCIIGLMLRGRAVKFDVKPSYDAGSDLKSMNEDMK